MIDYACRECMRIVTKASYEYFFNLLHDISKTKADLFAKMGICPTCFRMQRVEIDIEGIKPLITELHTRLNNFEKRLAKGGLP